ncbi:MAG: four helix bundle protein [Deltaproteobacteria bacterium]|nr:four helix bundle protein [Deltaproteobacteria bacterium]
MSNAECRKGEPRDIQERAFAFACRIIALHRQLVRSDATARTLAGQLLRAGTSIGANLEEACAGQSKPDFISKCAIALKEARETHYWLQLLSASGMAPAEQLDPLLAEANELISIVTAILRKARSNQQRGPE